MEVVILCGGKGARLNEYTQSVPKPMIEIGGKPILMHLMELYAKSGHKDFILCTGYKGEKIEEHFKDNKDWNIKFVNAGVNANKAERLMEAKNSIRDDTFLLAYGDDLSNVDINSVIAFHKKSGKVMTLVAIHLISQFGIIQVNENQEVTQFKEKPKLNHLMNGGFYVMDKGIFDYIKPGYDLEKETFEDLAKQNQIAAFKHNGFWKSMNTLKDVIELNELYNKGNAPWTK